MGTSLIIGTAGTFDEHWFQGREGLQTTFG